MRTGGKRIERELVIGIQVDLDRAWRLLRAELSGGLLYLRSIEAKEAKLLDEDDEGALARALNTFAGSLAKRLSQDGRSCKKTEATLSCGSVVVKLSDDGDEDEPEDIITIRRQGDSGPPDEQDDADDDDDDDDDDD